MKQVSNTSLWLRWVIANAWGEALGLSAVLLIGFGVLGPRLEGMAGAGPALLAIGAGMLLGIWEGTVLGVAQGATLRRRLTKLSLRTWVIATVAGAVVAWGLGMLPSTLMSADQSSGSSPAEMPEALTYLLAAVMGAVAGVVLSLAQWIVLRRHVDRAGRWLPANALAWALGMPLIFAGMGALPPGATVLQAAPIIIACTAAEDPMQEAMPRARLGEGWTPSASRSASRICVFPEPLAPVSSRMGRSARSTSVSACSL